MVLGIIMLIQPLSAKAQQSAITQGQWMRVPTTAEGICAIDANLLSAGGWQPQSINPAHIKVYSSQGGMLPQQNSIPVPDFTPAIATYPIGLADGTFDAGDQLLFYAQSADLHQYDSSTRDFSYQHHNYTDTVWFYITINEALSDQAGFATSTQANLGAGGSTVDYYQALTAHEQDLNQILQPGSGRNWFGEKFDATLQRSFPIGLSHPRPDTEARIVVQTVSQAFDSAYFEFRTDGQLLATSYVPTLFKGTYENKGASRRDTLTVPAQALSDNSITLDLRFYPHPIERGISYLDYYTLRYDALLRYDGESLRFRNTRQKDEALIFEISNAPAGLVLLNITDPFAAQIINYEHTGNTLRFRRPAGTVEEFILFDPAQAITLSNPETVNTPDLHSGGTPDLLIITHGSLRAQAERLASHRRNHDGLSVRVVTVQDIYHQYNGGKQDITAIRNYVRSLGSSLRYLLFFGKGTFDYRGIYGGFPNLVPTYESRNSTHPIFSYSSDDYFGLLEDHEGYWEESSAGDATLDIGIGRIPVLNVREASAVVDKIIRYQTDPSLQGSWKNRLFFVADDGDRNLHLRDAETLVDKVNANHNTYNIDKVYLDAFPQQLTANSQSSPDARLALQNALDRSGLIVNFTGHGDEGGWMFEDILVNADIETLNNGPRLPFFVTATCEFGRNDDPIARSGAELLVINPLGGAIAMVTTARPVFASTNLELNKAFYDAVFSQQNGQYLRLGDIIRLTKNNSLSGPVNRNFTLLGDPSMRLAYPENDIVLTTINQQDVTNYSDTLKALQQVTVSGEIRSQTGTLLSDFNGTLEVTVFDLPTQFQTLGNENPVTNFDQRTNVLFRGQATVTSGQFQLTWINPKNISYQPGSLKLSLYAYNGQTDAAGASEALPIGNQTDTSNPDNAAPQISAWLENRLFRDGSITGSNPLLILDLQDQSGINLSVNGLDQGITAILDDSASYQLSDFYIAAPDDFTQGTVEFNLQNIPAGEHTLKILVWDTHNNVGQASIRFQVDSDRGIRIDQVLAIPTPFGESVKIAVTHNREGDDLQINAAIYNLQGQKILQHQQTQFSAPAEIDVLQWKPGTQNDGLVEPGIYLLELIFESLSDGSKNRQIEKLVYRK